MREIDRQTDMRKSTDSEIAQVAKRKGKKDRKLLHAAKKNRIGYKMVVITFELFVI